MKFGVDTLIEQASVRLKTARLGLVTNDGARTAAGSGICSRVALSDSAFQLIRLFSPEHGIAAKAADGAPVADQPDPLTGLPVRSLYGTRVKPLPEDLDGLDAVLFDLPDAGYRFYTYIWTLFLMMEACSETGHPLFVLDRPNPVGGELDAVEGPILDVERFGGFLGMDAIPVRHSLTMGELATLWQKEKFPGLDLTVAPMEGWRRDWHWPDTKLPFVPPSPALTSFEATVVYGGLCFLEGANVSVGRGTDRAFLQFGAPWIEPASLAAELRGLLPEAALSVEPVHFTPKTDPHEGVECAGIAITPVDPHCVRPVEMGIRIVATLLHRYPERFAWTPYQTAANPGGKDHFDRLAGKAVIRQRLEEDPASLRLDEIREWTSATGWQERVGPLLLYG